MIVCFTESQNRGPWRLFTFWRKKFGHCFVVDFDAQTKTWIMAECASERMNINIFRGKQRDILIGDLTMNAICVDASGEMTMTYFPRWLYCVSFVKHFLGMKKWWILTPYQLYCELRKNGHPLIFEEK